MDFIDEIKQLQAKIQNKDLETVANEEATKTNFVMPFIKALGFDVFDSTEVHPEFTADTPGVNSDKVDYAIIINNKISMLIECKHWKEKLDKPIYVKQLHKYFHVTDAKIGILTNGITYRFFTDTDKPNVMDEKPFFEFNILDFDESAVNELKRFSKSRFDLEQLEDVAKNLLYTKEIKRIFSEQLVSPEPEFVKFFANQVYSGKMVANVVEKFSGIVTKSLKEYINEQITKRLTDAIGGKITPVIDQPVIDEPVIDELKPEVKIITTEEELESYYIVKSILREIIDVKRIQHKDTQNYFGINLDGKVTKTICRLRLDGKKKTIAIVTADGKESPKEIKTIDEIYSVSSLLKDRLNYLTQNETQSSYPIEENI